MAGRHLLNKISAIAARFVSEDENRPTLQTVHVTDKHTEASDGHRLFRVTHQTEFTVDDFPKVEGFAGGELPPEGVTIPGKKLFEFFRNRPKGSKHTIISILQNVAIAHIPRKEEALVDSEEQQAPARVQLCSTDLVSPMLMELDQAAASYPSFEVVMPSSDLRKAVGVFNARYLADLFTAAADMVEKTNFTQVRVEFYKSKHGADYISVTAFNEVTKQRAFGLVIGARESDRWADILSSEV